MFNKDTTMKIKRFISLGVISAVLAMTFMNSSALATTIGTSLKRSIGSGEAPIIKAKWEMNGPAWSTTNPGVFVGTGTDDSVDQGAQFMPTGIWGDRDNPDAGEKDFSICAIVTDPDGVSDIDAVYTDWYYPSTHAYHHIPGANTVYPDMSPVPPDMIDGGVPGDPDFGILGCALPVTDENELHRLSKSDGLELFCNDIRTDNHNLPTFFGLYSYDEICGTTGELEKETAYVYCADKHLEWEDPAGDYTVEILAIDTAGVSSHTGTTNPHTNTFEYLPLTGFEVDFTGVDYGSVKLNVHKMISGDLNFGTPDKPTVRNVGNTRLNMHVLQDDMGFGTTDGSWNIEYDGRVGNNAADWSYYDPYDDTQLEDILDLSEIEEMDFSVQVNKFPNDGPYTGNMTLSSSMADFRQCVPL
jgi:hypothetical protein